MKKQTNRLEIQLSLHQDMQTTNSFKAKNSKCFFLFFLLTAICGLRLHRKIVSHTHKKKYCHGLWWVHYVPAKSIKTEVNSEIKLFTFYTVWSRDLSNNEFTSQPLTNANCTVQFFRFCLDAWKTPQGLSRCWMEHQMRFCEGILLPAISTSTFKPKLKLSMKFIF